MNKKRDLESLRQSEWGNFLMEKLGADDGTLKYMKRSQEKSIQRFKKDYGEEPDLSGAVESRLPDGMEPDWEEVKKKLRRRPLRMKVIGVHKLNAHAHLVSVEVLEGSLDWCGPLISPECPGEWQIKSIALIDPRHEGNKNKELLSLSGPRTLREGMELIKRIDPE